MVGTPSKHEYRSCVAMVLFNEAGQVLIAERIDIKQPSWQLPQGGIDDEERAEAAARRELLEEIGTQSVSFLAESARWITYDFPDAIATSRWQGRYRGQRVKLFAFQFTGSDNDIDLETENPEFRAWTWTDLESLPGLVVPFKKALYDAAVEDFSPLRDELRQNGTGKESGSAR